MPRTFFNPEKTLPAKDSAHNQDIQKAPGMSQHTKQIKPHSWKDQRRVAQRHNQHGMWWNNCQRISGEEVLGYNQWRVQSICPKLGPFASVPIAGALKVVVDRIKAIVIILEQTAMNQLIERVTNAIIDLLNLPTTHLASTILDLWWTTNNLWGAAVSITGTANKFTENANASLDYLTSIAMDVAFAAEELNAANKAQEPSSTIPQRVKEVTLVVLQEIKAASTLVTTSTEKLAEMTSSYKDVLVKTASQPSQLV